MAKKFKVLEKNAKDTPSSEIKDIQWEGEEVVAHSDTKLEADKGTGQPIIIRSFDFAANPEVFKQHKPTAQELFNSHKTGIESLLWKDGLKPFEGVGPRLMFSKNSKSYRFVITCTTTVGNTLIDTPKTLTQLLAK